MRRMRPFGISVLGIAHRHCYPVICVPPVAYPQRIASSLDYVNYC